MEDYIAQLAAKKTTYHVEDVAWYSGKQACLVDADGEPVGTLTEDNDAQGYADEELAAIATHYLATGDADCERILRKAYEGLL